MKKWVKEEMMEMRRVGFALIKMKRGGGRDLLFFPQMYENKWKVN